MHTILLLTESNIFVTFAWYGHLKYKESPLWIAIVVSWGIAFVEYCFQCRPIGLGTSPRDSWRLVTKSRRHAAPMPPRHVGQEMPAAGPRFVADPGFGPVCWQSRPHETIGR